MSAQRNVNIRRSSAADLLAVQFVLHQAFGADEGPIITGLVRDLLEDDSASPRISLIAETEGDIIGYILFSRAELQPPVKDISAAILAPLAVSPPFQSRGVGGELIQIGVDLLKDSGIDLIFVLGHPGYYPRHGFAPAGMHWLEAPFPIPEKNAAAWMVQALKPDLLGSVKGRVVCAASLNKLEYWQE